MSSDINYEYDVLIIEDSVLITEIIMEIFEKKGFTYISVHNGSDGMKELRKNSPKVILLDVHLPDSNGYDLCRKIKTIENLRNIPIIYLTGTPSKEIEKKVRETDANGYIKKPFQISDFDVLYQYLKK